MVRPGQCACYGRAFITISLFIKPWNMIGAIEAYDRPITVKELAEIRKCSIDTVYTHQDVRRNDDFYDQCQLFQISRLEKSPITQREFSRISFAYSIEQNLQKRGRNCSEVRPRAVDNTQRPHQEPKPIILRSLKLDRLHVHLVAGNDASV